MYFSEFGQIDECRMKEDKLTSKLGLRQTSFEGSASFDSKNPRASSWCSSANTQLGAVHWM